MNKKKVIGMIYLTIRNKVFARTTNNKSLYGHLPFRRCLQRDLMIRDGELKLGGSLIHSLQTFPDGTHGCSLRSSSGLSLVGRSKSFTVDTRHDASSFLRNTHAIGSESSDDDRRESLFTSERVDFTSATIICSMDDLVRFHAHACSSTSKWTVILARHTDI